MISIFSNDESTGATQPMPAPAPRQSKSGAAAQPPYSTIQHPAVSKAVAAPAAPATEKHGIFSWLSIGKAKKRLQMLETVSLGEKRFVALVQVDGRQFLIGGAPSNVGMLAELAPEESFHQVLRDATAGLNETPAAQPLQPAVAASAPAAVSNPLASPAEPLVTAPPATAAPSNLHVMAAPASPAPAGAAPVMAAPHLEPAAHLTVSMPEPVIPPAPVPYTSIAPLSLAEGAPSASLIAAPVASTARKSARPSLPPHVAARLAELQADTQEEEANAASSTVPDDLSLEEPVSFSPSLLAAMQQRARAALVNDQAQMVAAPLQQAPAQPVSSQRISVAVHEAAHQQAAIAPVSASSFTFQFTPMLTSTTQAVRIPGMNLQGAA